MNTFRWLGVLATMAVMMGLAVPGALAQSITFAKDAALRSEPRFDAAPVTQVKQGTAGEAGAKQGPWLNVKTAAGAGWVLTTEVAYASAGSASSSGSSFNPFARRQTASTTSTIGIRGLTADDIRTAMDKGAIDTKQLALLDGYEASKSDGQTFASAQGLAATPINY